MYMPEVKVHKKSIIDNNIW